MREEIVHLFKRRSFSFSHFPLLSFKFQDTISPLQYMNSELILVSLFYIKKKTYRSAVHHKDTSHHFSIYINIKRVNIYVGLKSRLIGRACMSEDILSFSDTHVTHLIHYQHCKSHRQPFLFSKEVLLF